MNSNPKEIIVMDTAKINTYDMMIIDKVGFTPITMIGFGQGIYTLKVVSPNIEMDEVSFAIVEKEKTGGWSYNPSDHSNTEYPWQGFV